MTETTQLAAQVGVRWYIRTGLVFRENARLRQGYRRPERWPNRLHGFYTDLPASSLRVPPKSAEYAAHLISVRQSAARQKAL